MNNEIAIKNLSVGFQTPEGVLPALEDISFTLTPGKILALMGESGCGKSLTALTLLQLLPPSARFISGTMPYQGQDCFAMPEVAFRALRGKAFAMIFQDPQVCLNPVLTIGQQLLEQIIRHQHIHPRQHQQEARRLLAQVHIPDPQRILKSYPHQLSGGMKQRVMIAIALAGKPSCLIADEPTTALDVTIQAEILALLREIQQETKMSVLLISHDLGIVESVADEVMVMYAGRIVERASVKDFFAKPSHPYSRALLAATPHGQAAREALVTIPGQVPSIHERDALCTFRARCLRRAAVCNKQVPPWQSANGAEVYCHLPSVASEERTQTSLAPVTLGETVLDVSDWQVRYPLPRQRLWQRKRYLPAVQGVSLTLRAGETLGLVGESGCGKSSLAKSLLGLEPAHAGQMVLAGETYQAGHTLPRSLARHCQLIFQDPFSAMNPRMMVGEILAEGLRAQGLSQADLPVLLAQVGLGEEVLMRYPHEFSGGQRQRMTIARALALQPQVLICDEPTSALDVSIQAQILNLLRQLQRDRGLAYLFISHDLSVVGYLADRVAVMYLGRIVEEGPAEAILSDPKHPYTQALKEAMPGPGGLKSLIEGELANPANPPSGCPYHPRCPHATTLCRQKRPTLNALNDSRKVACYLY